MSQRRRAWSARALAILLLVSAAKHRRSPQFYYPVIPAELTAGRIGASGASAVARPIVRSAGASTMDRSWARTLPTRREWVELSGSAEVLAAIGLLLPPTRRVAAGGVAVMFAGFTVGHLEHLRNVFGVGRSGRHGNSSERVFATIRLPLQIPLVFWAWSLARRPRSR